MKKLASVILALLILFASFTAMGTADPRLEMRSGDDMIPACDGQFFTRYTPWLKAYHPMTTAEVASGAHGGEACQQIRALDISPVDSNLIIFGTDTSGVWISTDGGDFWYNTHRGISPANISDVMCHSTNKNIMFCYTIGTGTTEATAPGIYRSEDMGRSWERVFTDYISSSMTDKLFACDQSGNIYAATGHGVIKSTDDGETWNIILPATEENSASNRAPAASIKVSVDGQTIAACYSTSNFSLGGIIISQDGGATWNKLSFDVGSGETAVNAYAFEFDANNKNRYLAAIYSPTLERYGLFISDDKGQSWKEFKSSGTSNDTHMVRNFDSIRRMRLTEDYLYVAYYNADKAFRSLPYSYLGKDVSSAWFPYIYKWTALDMGDEIDCSDKFRAVTNMGYSQGFDIEGDAMFVCTAGPHKYSFSTDTWERKSEGFSGNLVQHFNMDEGGNLLLSRTDGNIIRSSSPYTENSPATFSRPTGDYKSTVATIAIPDPYDAEGDRIIGWSGTSNSTGSHLVIISEDNGKTWTKYSDSADSTGCDAVLLEYSRDENEKKTIFTSSATSPDNGITWKKNSYYYLDIDGENSEKILAWDLYGTSPTYKFMYSSDKGVTWETLAKVGTSKGSEVTAFFDNSDKNLVWYKEQYDFGTIDLTTGVKTSYKAKAPYKMAFNNLVQNPSKPNHFILTAENTTTGGYCPTLMESVDYGASWHVVPGFFGCRTVANGAVTFSTTTNEVFIGSLSGIAIYEYDNFDYYQATLFKNGNEELLTTCEMLDGRVTLPDPYDFFAPPANHTFEGWEYKGNIYAPGEKVTIE